MEVSFQKMNGLGNDFVIIDAREQPLQLSKEQIIKIANRKNGIGCDQLIIIEPHKMSDCFMRIYNNDGGEVDACGNATRCIADILLKETGKAKVIIRTNVSQIICEHSNDGLVQVDMGKPKLKWNEIPLAEEFADTRYIELQIGPIDNPILHSPSVVNMGNPHCIFWVNDVNDYDLTKIGSLLEYHMMFPEQANISLAQVIDRKHIILKVWERGAGITKACGTAACAAVVAAVRKNLADREANVKLPGGSLLIHWQESDEHVLMTGPVTYEFNDIINLSTM